MKNIKLTLTHMLLLTCLYSVQSTSSEINKSGLIGLSNTATLKEYAFSLSQETTLTFDLAVLDQAAGEMEATLLLAQGVKQHLKVNLDDSKTLVLAAGEYQLMVYAKLMDAEFAHIEVKARGTKVLVDDVITLLDTKITSANTYRKIQQDFFLSGQEKVTLELTDYAQLTGFTSELASPLVHTLFTLSNTETPELKYYGGVDGLLDADLGAGNYQLQVHLIADLQAHSSSPALISGLGWSLTSTTSGVGFSNLELITSESISSGKNENVYNLGIIDFGEGGNYDFAMNSVLGLNISDEKVLFVQDTQAGGSLSLNSDSLYINDVALGGVYKVFAFIPDGKSGALNLSVKQSGSDQAFWAQSLPLGETRFLKSITLAADSQLAVQINDLGFANVMQTAEFMLTNGLNEYVFSLAEGSHYLGGVVKAGNYSRLAVTRAEGNALLYLDIQTDEGESLYQDYVFEGRGGFYAEVVTLSGGEYAVSTKDHALPAPGNSYSAVVLQRDQLLYKHQSFGGMEVFDSELINLAPGEYVLAFSIDPSEVETMVLGYVFSVSVSETSLVEDATDRSLGDADGKKSSGGSLGYFFLFVLLIAVYSRITGTTGARLYSECLPSNYTSAAQSREV